MPRYWVIAPYSHSPRHIFDAVWEWSLRNGLITIGWHEAGNLVGAPKEEIRRRYLETYDNQAYPSLQRFLHDIEIGDRVIARGGLKRIVGLGTVESSPYFDLELGRAVTGGRDENVHPNFMRISWMKFEHDFHHSVFSGHLKTVTELKGTDLHWPELRNVLRERWPME